MDIKRIIFATLSYVIITMAIAFPWHMIWFHDVYGAMGAFTRPEPIIPLGMAAIVTQGVIIAYLYPYYYNGGSPVIQGIKFSLLMGAIVYSVMGLAMAAKIDINPIADFLIYSVIFQFIQFIMTGIALGLIYKNTRA